VEPVTASKLLDYLYSHIKGNSVLKADMPCMLGRALSQYYICTFTCTCTHCSQNSVKHDSPVVLDHDPDDCHAVLGHDPDEWVALRADHLEYDVVLVHQHYLLLLQCV
jgi:hypothetical protein